MFINVSQLLKEPIGSERKYEVDEALDVTGEGKQSQVKGDVKLTRTNRGILAQGKLLTKIEITCSRCLCLFDCPIALNIEDEFFPTIDVNTGVPLELPDEGGFTIDEHHILDLGEGIRQNALLSIPMKPLCREECAGLCAQCGKDLNVDKCDCVQSRIDSRWDKLASLKTRKTRK